MESKSSYYQWLIILGVITILLLIFPNIYTFLYIIIVGVILVPVLVIIPFLFSILLGGVIYSIIAPILSLSDNDKNHNIKIGMIVTVLLLAFIPWYLNFELLSKVKEVRSKDFDYIKTDIKTTNLAIRAEGSSISELLNCNDACSIALTSGKVDNVMFFNESPALDAMTKSFSLKHDSDCQINILREKVHNLLNAKHRGYDEEHEIQKCFQSRDATLYDADIIIDYTTTRENITKNQTGIFSKTIFYLKENGNLKPIYQDTTISYRVFGPVLGVAPEFSSFSTSMEVWKTDKVTGYEGFSFDDTMIQILSEKLGIKQP